MIFGGSPAAGMTVGAVMTCAMFQNYMQKQLSAIGHFRRSDHLPAFGFFHIVSSIEDAMR
jgi:hypothetical protein